MHEIPNSVLQRNLQRKNKAQMFGVRGEGICQICNTSCELTKSHVPAKSLYLENSIKRSAQDFFWGGVTGDVKKNLQSGIYFYTLCKNCNSMVGSRYEEELKRFSGEVANRWRLFRNANSFTLRYQPNKVARAVIAGMLTLKPRESHVHYSTTREYVLDTSKLLPKPFKIGFWLHNYKSVTLLPQIAYGRAGGDLYTVELIVKCYPFAWVVINSELSNADFFANYNIHDITPQLSSDIDAKHDITINTHNQKDEFWPWWNHGFFPIIGGEAEERAILSDPYG